MFTNQILHLGRLLPATDEYRRASGQVVGKRSVHRGQVDGQLLEENLFLEATQRRVRLDAQLLPQYLAGLLIGAQRLGLLVGSVERNHQLAPEPFPERELPDEALQLGEHRSVSSAGKVGRDPVLETYQAQLLETSDLAPSEVVVGEILECSSSPQIECLGQSLPRDNETPLTQGRSPFLGQRLEPPHVQLIGFQTKNVPARHRGDRTLLSGASVWPQRVAQLRDVIPQRLGTTLRHVVAPHRLEKPINRHHPVGMDQEYPEQGPRFRGTDPARGFPVGSHQQRSQDAKLHPSTLPTGFTRGPRLFDSGLIPSPARLASLR